MRQEWKKRHEASEPEAPEERERVLTRGKVGMVLFLASDAMSFIGFLSAYLVLRFGAIQPKMPGEVAWFPDWAPPLPTVLPLVATLSLLVSALCMRLAARAARAGAASRMRGWMGAALAGSLFFLGAQGFEWNRHIERGLTIQGIVVPELDTALERAAERGLNVPKLTMAEQLFGGRHLDAAPPQEEARDREALAAAWPRTTLIAALEPDEKTLVVADGSGLPARGRLLVGEETVTYERTDVQALTALNLQEQRERLARLTLTERGAPSTSHPVGTVVTSQTWPTVSDFRNGYFSQELFELLGKRYVDDEGTRQLSLPGAIHANGYGVSRAEAGLYEARGEEPQALLEMPHRERVALGARVPSPFASSFYILTAFHGFQLSIATLVLIVVLIRSFAQGTKMQRTIRVGAFFWHFLCLIWLVLYAMLYITG